MNILDIKEAQLIIPYKDFAKKSGVKKIEFIQKDCFCLSDYQDTAILVFGSQNNPGGGILSGAKAQEEDISLKTTWYFQVKNKKDYYGLENSCINSDNLLYAKGFIYIDEYGFELADYKRVNLISFAAPNLKGILEKNEPIEEKNIYKALEKRIDNTLFHCEIENNKKLILGAIGCGVFGLDVEKVAQCFNRSIHKNYFSGDIIFAIPDEKKLEVFQNNVSIQSQVVNKNKM